MKPTNIKADRNERILTITWEEGRECRYPFAGLRVICPCVECRGGHENMGGPPDMTKLFLTPNEGMNIEKIEAVGSYALQIAWSDGHWTGIYTWEYLRQACSDN